MISFKSKDSRLGFLADENVLSSLAGLELLVKKTVEGIRGGVHKASTSGSSVEFSEHLRYYPGQDLKNVDWKAFARTDRYFIKSYEKEARLLAMNILDCSGSMNYKGSRTKFSKFEFSKIISGALSYLLLKQGDSAGAIFFADNILSTVPIDSRPEHLMFLLKQIAEAECSIESKTDYYSPLMTAGRKMDQKGLIIIYTDLLGADEKTNAALLTLCSQNYHIALVNILSPDEVDLPFSGQIEFKNMEGKQTLFAEPVQIAKSYNKEIEEYVLKYKSFCLNNNIDFINIVTSQTPQSALIDVLQSIKSNISGGA